MGKETNISPSCGYGGCITFLLFIFILFNLKDVWGLLEKGLEYLINL